MYQNEEWINRMTEDQLKEEAKKKNDKGVATKTALKAQTILWNKFHYPENVSGRKYNYEPDSTDKYYDS